MNLLNVQTNVVSHSATMRALIEAELVRTCESGNCWEQHSGSHQGSSSRLDEFDRERPNQIAEQSHKQCRTNAFVANIGNHQAYLRTVEDEAS